MKNTIEIRLEIIRCVREFKMARLDHDINILEDQGADSSLLRSQRQRLRVITDPYKALLAQEGDIALDDANPLLNQSWDVFTSVDWN